MADRLLNQAFPGHVAKARVLNANGDIQRAESEIQKARRIDSVSLPALAELLKLWVAGGTTDEAMDRIAGLLQQHPRNAGLHFLRHWVTSV